MRQAAVRRASEWIEIGRVIMQPGFRHSCLRVAAVTGAILFLMFTVSCSGSDAQNRAAGARSTPATSAAPAWTTFQDPFEKAFTAEVPKGWTAKGGLFRMGYSDQRPMVDLTSPDGRVNVRIGDVSIPIYAAPNQFHREGDTYDLGAQAQLVAAHYREGPEFAALYAKVRFHSYCRSETEDMDDLGGDVPNYIPSDGPPPEKVTAGQIASHCVTDQGPRVAFAFARTAEVKGGLWFAVTLGSFLAPADQVAQARAVMMHCAQTLKVSPEWLEYQKKLDEYALEYQRARQNQRMQELAGQVRQFEQKMQAMRSQVDAFRRRQDAQAAQVEGFTQALRGVTPTLDPLTGESREVWTGQQDGYWANGLGQVANSSSSPGAGWHPLHVVRPQ